MACVGLRPCGEGVFLGPVSAPQDATHHLPVVSCFQEELTWVHGLWFTGRTSAAPKQEPDPRIRVLVKGTHCTGTTPGFASLTCRASQYVAKIPTCFDGKVEPFWKSLSHPEKGGGGLSKQFSFSRGRFSLLPCLLPCV